MKNSSTFWRSVNRIRCLRQSIIIDLADYKTAYMDIGRVIWANSGRWITVWLVIQIIVTHFVETSH